MNSDDETRWRVLFRDNPQGMARGELRVPTPTDLTPHERARHVVTHAYIAECNDAYARVYGFGSAREVVGLSLPELLDVDLATAESAMRDILAGAFVKPNWERYLRRRDGRWRWLYGNTIPVIEAGAITRWWATVEDITERKRESDLLAQLAAATTSTGTELFEGLVRGLAAALDADVVYLAAIDPPPVATPTQSTAAPLASLGSARSLAVWADGAAAAPFAFTLDGTPDARIALGDVVVIERDVATLHPRDARLVRAGDPMQGWLGVPLIGVDDAVEGMLVAMQRGPLDPPPTHVLRLAAARAAAELARVRAEGHLMTAQAKLEKALARSERRVLQLEEQVGEPAAIDDVLGMVGHSPAMQQVQRRLRLVAQSDVTVLVTGETGTGKELAASALHRLSPRAAGPFVALSCVELPESLLESELFGHVRGAFTGAQKDKLGLFQAARGGTLFLDEIGELSPFVQAKLLRVLQERQVRRVGDHRPIPIDVRLVCATHRDLRALIRAGTFREDLYFRIQVFEVNLPPLVQRRGDIPLLVARFLDELSTRHKKPLRGIDAAALELLQAHAWPGNVRELRNAIEHAVISATRDHIRVDDLPPLIDPKSAGASWSSQPVADPELRARIVAALDASNGHRENAARALGMSRVTLWKKMKALGLSD